MAKKTKTTPCALLILTWVFSLLLICFTFLGAYHIHTISCSYLDILATGLVSVGLFLTLLNFRESMRKDNESRMGTLFENTPAALHCMDLTGNITRVSDMWLDFFKLNRKEAVGRNFSEFICEDSRTVYAKKVLQPFRADEKCKDVQLNVVIDGKEVAVVFISLTPFGHGKGKADGLVVVSPEKKHKADVLCRKFDYYDFLTGLPNNFLITDRMKNALERAVTTKEKVAFLQIDMDQPRNIPSGMEILPSDLFIRAVATRLKENIRTGDTLARLPGNVFGLLPYGVQSAENLIPMAERLCRLLSQPMAVGEISTQSTASIGIALFPEDGRNVGTLIQKANVAMFTAKAEGGDKFHFVCPKMNAQAEKRVQLQRKLGQALLKKEFFLLFQPQIDIASARVTGFEALLRWKPCDGGMILPDEFLPVMEESDLSFVLGEWVLRQACHHIATGMDQEPGNVRVSVNISKRHFMSSGFIPCVDHVLHDSRIDPGFLEMDLQESLLMTDDSKVVDKLKELRKRGIRLAIDDYGLGGCSITRLKYLPVERVKIARKFLEKIPENRDAQALLETFMGVAHGLGLGTLAKGIENKKQFHYLRSLNCTEGQGFYFSEPLPGNQCLFESSSCFFSDIRCSA